MYFFLEKLRMKCEVQVLVSLPIHRTHFNGIKLGKLQHQLREVLNTVERGGGAACLQDKPSL